MGILREVFDLAGRASARVIARVMVPLLLQDRQLAMMGFDPYSHPGKLRSMDEETKRRVIEGIDNELAYWGVPDYEEHVKKECGKNGVIEPRNGL